MQTLEQKIIELNEMRQKINQLDSFDEINVLWNKLNDKHNECQKELNDLNDNINKIIEDKATGDIDLTFQQAFNELQSLSVKIDNSSISCALDDIKKMQTLYYHCLKVLESESAKITEIKS